MRRVPERHDKIHEIDTLFDSNNENYCLLLYLPSLNRMSQVPKTPVQVIEAIPLPKRLPQMQVDHVSQTIKTPYNKSNNKGFIVQQISARCRVPMVRDECY